MAHAFRDVSPALTKSTQQLALEAAEILGFRKEGGELSWVHYGNPTISAIESLRRSPASGLGTRNDISFDFKVDAMFGFLFRRHELSDRLEDRSDVFVMVPNAIFEIFQFREQMLLADEHSSQLDECTHDGDIDLDSSLAVKDAREHRDPLLCESVDSFGVLQGCHKL